MRIIIADDHAVVRSGFKHLLDFQNDMKVIATAADGREAYDLVSEHAPDIVLLDLSMPPGESGLITTGRIKEDFPETKIIILTMYAEEEYLYNVLKSGASGYVLKKAPDEELLTAIRTVYAGGTYIDPAMATSVVAEYVKNSTISQENAYQSLSPRELEVLPLAAKGYTNKEIAEMLYISVKTVEAHKSNIMSKLNLSGRPELIEYALKKRLLDF
ncbi:MAG TPA: response regulator transcription factor [Bacillota bacterium]|nr:response regulator transcription factor [Bacillota bacterium]